MLHGSPARAAHRASSGGPGTLSPGRPGMPARRSGRPATGQHRVPQQRRARRAPHEPARAMHLLMTGLGVVILLAICGLSGFFVIADDRRGVSAAASSGSPAATSRTLSSRQSDAAPLTVAEVFGERDIRLTSGAAPYTVAVTHVDRDCDIAATGDARGMLDRYGCSQVVRAALMSPYGGYRVTAGVFNLSDDVGAERMAEQIRPLVESGEGGFPPLTPGAVPGTAPEPEPAAQVGWQHHGHYLVYCVIAAPDGKLVRADDPYARQITTDLLETYLAGTVLAARG